ncbi:hypothetical protein V6N11_016843 [Hibiscus sabdariffa]|uniref:Uncharacterized protein n=1 Tax=Hibiscus sabdariffa TaxID=183260 RepID=A0ABR2TX32_9ROSI
MTDGPKPSPDSYRGFAFVPWHHVLVMKCRVLQQCNPDSDMPCNTASSNALARFLALSTVSSSSVVKIKLHTSIAQATE